jgi:hypothetical protein
MRPQWRSAIPLGTTDLWCDEHAEDLTCRRYAADNMNSSGHHLLDPSNAAEDWGHLRAKAWNSALGWRFAAPR